MPEIRIELPAETLESIRIATEQQGLNDSSAFISRAIAAALSAHDRERARIDQLLLEGLDSGPARPMSPSDWEELRRRVHERAAAQTQAI